MSDRRFIPVSEPFLGEAERDALARCIESGWISSEGPEVERFEHEMAAFAGRRHGIAVSSGTAALDVAVAALQIGPGDEVILPTFTIISCVLQIVRSGATPVFVDSDALTWNIDADAVESVVTPRTRALLVPHIYGLPADMGKLLSIAERHGLALIEDAAEAHGLQYHGRPCGSFGDVSTFSFYPNKLITTGEGGMVVTDDDQIADRCRRLRNLSFEPGRRFVHHDLGWNYRMTNLQAALGLAQLGKADEFLARKRSIGHRYHESLSEISGLRLQPVVANDSENVFWVFGIVLECEIKVEVLMEELKLDGIGTRPFFYPLHLQPVMRKMGFGGQDQHPVAEYIAQHGFYLPTGGVITDDEIDYVAATLHRRLGMTA
jgi:perosamine synthetase